MEQNMTKPAIYEGYPEPHKVTGHNIPSPEGSAVVSTEVTGCCITSPYDLGVGTGGGILEPVAVGIGGWPYVSGSTISSNTKTHRIWLRKNFEVVVELPEDVTPSELNRLCSFLDLLVEP